MARDLKWFRKKLIAERDKSTMHDPMYHFVDGIIKDLNQVEPPEITINQAWEKIEGENIEEALFNNIAYVRENGFAVSDIPEIPKYVAEYIEWAKEQSFTLGKALRLADVGQDGSPHSWSNIKNLKKLRGELGDCDFERTLSRAWLDGFTIKKEKKYKVEDAHGNTLLYKVGKGQTRGGEVVDSLVTGETATNLLTKDEIESYDPDYMIFAKESDAEMSTVQLGGWEK